MHAVFKDDRARIVASVVDVVLFEIERWLSPSVDGVRCEIYEDGEGVRGRLVTVYVREDVAARWRPV